MYDSKIDIRVEAVRIASMMRDVEKSDIVDVARKIAGFITEGIELKDVNDPNAAIKEAMEVWKAEMAKGKAEKESDGAVDGDGNK